MTPFTPKTYNKEVPKSRQLPGKPGPNGKDIYHCPMAGCPLWIPAFRLTDVRKVPNAITGGASWACDGCIQGWIRNMELWSPGVLVCEARLAEAFGAPPDVIANLEEGLLRRRSRHPQIDNKFKDIEE